MIEMQTSELPSLFRDDEHSSVGDGGDAPVAELQVAKEDKVEAVKKQDLAWNCFSGCDLLGQSK